jgi:hypothetical protein
LIAYIDILGFKNIIENEKENAIKKITGCINKGLQSYNKLLRNTSDNEIDFTGAKIIDIKNPKHLVFSDSVIFHIEDEENNLIRFLFALGCLQKSFIEHNIFIRGSVAKGEIFEDKKNVFGPGVNEAYKLESEIAIFPRIVIHDDLVLKLKEKEAQFPLLKLNRYIIEDYQGVFFLDYLSIPIFPIIKKNLTKSEITSFKKHKKNITEELEDIKNLRNERNKDKIIGKYLMLSCYHDFIANQFIDEQQRSELLFGMDINIVNIFFKKNSTNSIWFPSERMKTK